MKEHLGHLMDILMCVYDVDMLGFELFDLKRDGMCCAMYVGARLIESMKMLERVLEKTLRKMTCNLCLF